MISFVAYFSSAQDEEGFVVLNGYGSAPAEFTDGPAVESGTYRVEGNNLVRVDTTSNTGEHEADVESLSIGKLGSDNAEGGRHTTCAILACSARP